MRTRYDLLVTALLLPACTGDALRAVDDTATVVMDGDVAIAVLDNDTGIASPEIAVTVPAHGSAVALADAVHYTPAPLFAGTDTFEYTINEDGAVATAIVTIEVTCATCAVNVPVQLAWDPNPPADMLIGYRLYLGPAEDPTTMTLADDIELTEAGFDPLAPTKRYDAWNDLRLVLGEQACFRMTAYNAGGESGFSNAACKPVDGSSMVFGL